MPFKLSFHVNKSAERAEGSRDLFSQGCWPLILLSPKPPNTCGYRTSRGLGVKWATLEQE